jgi:Mg/Co/Ni transporter MgtE
MMNMRILLIAPINDNEVINLIDELNGLNILKYGEDLSQADIRKLLEKDIDDLRSKVNNMKHELFGLSWD